MKIRFLLLTILLVNFLHLSPSHVSANAITVDEVSCTLIDAILSANTDTAVGGCAAGNGADTIILDANVSLAVPYESSTGLPFITSEITIQAGGGDTISGNSTNFRIFSVQSSGNLTLEGITLTGGRIVASFAIGGAIYNYGTLTIINSTLSLNSVEVSSVGSDARGGAIYNAKTLTIINSTLSLNSAEASADLDSASGGAIYSSGLSNTLTITGSTISENSVVSLGGRANGGGIYAIEPTTIEYSTITNNAVMGNSSSSDGVSGGGIEINGGEINYSTIAYNTVQSTNDHSSPGPAQGGGISGSRFIVQNSTVSHNTAQSGNSTTSYSDDVYGGGINGSYFVIKNSTISENTVQTGNAGKYDARHAYGGGVSGSDSTIINSTISGNIAQGGTGDRNGGHAYGGGISGSGLTITNSTISGNIAQGGVGSNNNGGNAYGGGISGDELISTHNTITLNDSLGGTGSVQNGVSEAGGLRVTGATTTYVRDTILADNLHNDCFLRTGAILLSQGYNLVETPNNCLFDAPTDLLSIAPQLQPLADNGGSTETHALNATSPAIDAGSCQADDLPYDQRELPRPLDILAVPNVGDGCDIGAFELVDTQSMVVVTTTLDEQVANSTCSLREAITLVNGGLAADCGVLGSGPYIIFLPSGFYTIDVAVSDDDANLQGDFDITTSTEVLIRGFDTESTIIQASTLAPSTIIDPPQAGEATNRIFHITNPSANIHIQDVTLRHGLEVSGDGGAIYNAGSLALTDMTIVRNRGENNGGAIANTGTLTANHVNFEQNETQHDGSAIYSTGNLIIDESSFTQHTGGLAGGDNGGTIWQSGNTLTLTNSDFLNNMANKTAGLVLLGANAHIDTVEIIYNQGQALHSESTTTIRNSTFAYQITPNNGGVVVASAGNLDIVNSTIANNGGSGLADMLITNGASLNLTNSTVANSTNAEDIRNDGGTVTITNTLLNNNNRPTACSLTVNGGVFNDGNGNLAYPGTNCGFSGDLNDGLTDPVLSVLANYGGPTLTMALGINSPAIDGTGDSCPISVNGVDQRGEIRDVLCDIGAYESTSTTPPSLVVSTTLDELTTNGECSLREAITLVNGGSASDCGVLGSAPHIITIPAGVYTITIGNTWEDNNLDGDFDITTTDEVIFVGASDETTIIEASTIAYPQPGYTDHRLFHITQAGTTVSFNQVTLRHGVAMTVDAEENGAGIYAPDSIIYLNDSTLSFNFGAYGAGIFADEAHITQSSISNNESWRYSIIEVKRTFIESSSFLFNELASFGGGALTTQEMHIFDSTFSDNVFGVITYNSRALNTNTQSIIENSTFENNESGNAIVDIATNQNDAVTIKNSQFNNNGNFVLYYGVVHVIGNAHLIDDEFFDNANTLDGVISIQEDFPFNLPSNVLIENTNFSNEDIPSIWLFGNNFLHVKNSSFSNSGGGIYNFESDVIISDSSFDNLSNPVYNGANAHLTMVNSTLADSYVAIINDANGDVELINSTIASDSASNAQISNAGTITITNSIVTNPTGANCNLNANGTGTFTDGGGNLEYPGTSCGFSGVLNDGTHDPLLLPLADNGGPTQTMALDVGSPAIDGTGAVCPAEVNGVDQRGEPRSPICDIGAYEFGTTESTNDALILFDPTTSDTSYHYSVLDNPDTFDFTNMPPTNTASVWVMGDWDGDGDKTPGYFDSGAFRYTNDSGVTSNWSNGIWLGNAGSRVGVVSGRYASGFANDNGNDCIGWVDSGTSPVTGDLRFSLKYWCDMTATGAVSLSAQWLGSPLGDSQGFSGTHQFAYGDWDNDGLEEPGIRRAGRITRSNNAPGEGAATYPAGSAQRWDTGDGDGPGAHGLNDGLFVAGDWNGDGMDTWGVVYDDDTFYYRDVFGFNPGPFEFSSQTFSSSVATPRQVDSHHNATGGSSLPAPASPVIVVAQQPTSTPTQVVITDTPLPMEIPPTEILLTDTPEPTVTTEPTNTPISVGVAPPTDTLVPTDTPEPTVTNEPSLTPTPIVIEPSATPVPTDTPMPTATDVPNPVRLPVMESMDNGAPNWLATGSWILTEDASYTPNGLGWLATSTENASTLQFHAPIILGNVPYPNLRFQSNLQATHSSAQVEISLDAQTWLVVAIIEPGEGWVEQSIDLSDYRSMTIYLRFNWVSSETTTAEGQDFWMVDEVDLRNHPFDDPTATPAPIVIEPTEEPSGGGSTIGIGGQPTAEPPAPTPVPGVTQIIIGN